jgi:hypothetical protein
MPIIVGKSANNFEVENIVVVDSTIGASEVLYPRDMTYADMDLWAKSKTGDVLIWVPKGVYSESNASRNFWYKFLIRAQSGNHYKARFLIVSQDPVLFSLGVSSIHVEPDSNSLKSLAVDMISDYKESGEVVCNNLQKITVKVAEGQLYLYGVDR